MTSLRRSLTMGTAALILAIVLGVQLAPSAIAQAPRTMLDWLLVDSITVLNGNLDILTGNLTLTTGNVTATAGNIVATAGDFTATAGDFTATAGNITATAGNIVATAGNVTAGADFNMTAQTGIVVTEGSTITPTGAYQPISAAGPVSAGGITAGTAGDILILVNTSANAITIVDTGTLVLSGNAVLGQYDTLTLLADGTNWIELAQTDN